MKNHNYLLSFCFLLFFYSSLQGQVSFQKTFGTSGAEVGNWVANTTTGYIVAGNITPLNSNRDGYLLNLDFNGNIIWQKRIGGPDDDRFNVVYQVSDGFLVLGETKSYGAGDDDMWLLKISPTGNVLWSKTIGDAATRETANSMIAVSGDRILISGSQAPSGTSGVNACFYLLNSAGQNIWSRTYESGSTGNLMRCNYVNNGIIYASGGAETEGAFMRLDLETGDFIDGLLYPGNSTEALYYAQPTTDGNILLCDHTWSATGGVSMKQWVNKVSPEGQTIWSKVFSAPNVNLRGRIESAGFDNFLLTPYNNSFDANSDAMLVKIDEDGNIMWARNYGKPGPDWLLKSQQTPDGGFISVGSATNSNGNLDVLLIKTNDKGLVTGCCIPRANVLVENYSHPDEAHPFFASPWSTPEISSTQPVNANAQERDYCGISPVEIFHDVELCANEAFTFHGVDYYAPDEVLEVLPGLFGCDTTIHYNLQLLPQVFLTQTITFCAGESVTFNGQSYSQPDTVVLNIHATSGCDTIKTYYFAYDTVPDNCKSCKGTYLKIVGDAGESVHGNGVYDAKDGNLYITGTRQDSALLVKMTPSGKIIWSRTFEVTPLVTDNITEIIVDSDGMITGCGQSGDTLPIVAGFVFRYDPVANSMIWLQKITGGDAFVMGIVEKAPGQNFILNSNPNFPENNIQLTEISRTTGNEVPGVLTKSLHAGVANNFNAMLIDNGKLYGVGRVTGGVQMAEERSSLTTIDLATGGVDISLVKHSWFGPNARLFGMDLVNKNGLVTSVGYGDETGTNLNNSKIFLYNDNVLNGTQQAYFRIDIQETTSEAVDEIVAVPDGHILLCHSLLDAPGSVYLIRVNLLGKVMWSKRIDYGQVHFLPVSIVQSQILVKDDFLYCVASATNAAGEDQMLILKMSLNGKMDGNCDYISDTPVASEFIQFSTGQTVVLMSAPAVGALEALPVTVSSSAPASNYACRSLVDDMIMVSLCPGDSILLGGQSYSQADTVVLTFTGTNGCDSILTYFISVLPQPVRADTITFCAGGSVTIGGQVYTQSGTVVDTIPGSVGCDTIVTYTLILLPKIEIFNDIALCPGQPFTYNGVDHFAPGEFVVVVPGNNGCDSIIHYGLLLLPHNEVFNDIGLCPGQPFTYNGVDHFAPGEFIVTLTNQFGCDSIIHYGLLLLPQPTRAETLKFCPGESIVIGGQTYTQPGTVIDTIPAATGCDTIVTYTLISLLPAPSVIAVHCPNDISIIANPGTAPIVIDYAMPTAMSNCPCPGLDLSLTAGLASGAAFPNGITQVCYKAEDACGHSATCCFKVTVREIQPCDVKVIGCMRYELLSITADAGHNLTYRIKVTNSCPNKLIYTAIELPPAVTATTPANLSLFTAASGRTYDVRNPNFSPFYSIRFKSTTDSISNGQSDIFEYTLPAQSAPNYMDITSRLSPQLFFEAYLNTFNCPIGVTKPGNRSDDPNELAAESVTLFPNPSSGVLWVDLGERTGKDIQWRILNIQGQQVLESKAAPEEELLQIDLPEQLPNGLFFFELWGGNGKRQTLRFVVQR